MAFTWPDLLLDWFRKRKRDLPWRRTRDPYGIWVSEVMLQQTRVETVIPYYERWMDQFPTAAALAQAPEDQVLKAWEGLGYYSRARNLHQAVREVVSSYGGEVPADPEAFAALPGVGPYIKGAVQSIAYGRPVPAVDGNVLRVLSRIYNLDDDVTQPATRRKMEALVTAVIPPDAAGDFNQGLMELGALVCIPGQPRCGECPVAGHCQALAAGRTRDLPVRSRKTPPRRVRMAAGVVQDGSHLLLTRRPSRGLLAGLWEFPSTEVPAEATPVGALTQFLFQQWELEVEVEAPLPEVEHIFTHRHWVLQPFRCRLKSASRRPADRSGLRWVQVGEVAQFALPTVFRKVAAALDH